MVDVAGNLGLIEYGNLVRIKQQMRLVWDSFSDDEKAVARQQIKDGLIRIEIEGTQQIAYLTDLGEAALAGADLGIKLEAVNVDSGELSERIRQFAETRGKLAELEAQKAELLKALEEVNRELFDGVKALQRVVKDEEPLLEAEIKKAYGAGIEFGYAVNGIQIEQGTDYRIADETKLMRWLMDNDKTSLPDVDRKTGKAKPDGKPIDLLRLVNMHRFVSRYRDQITMGEIPEMSIVQTVKVAWSAELPALWSQGIVLGPPAPPEESEEGD